MAKSNIFVTSSERAKLIAETLSDGLRTDYSSAKIWQEIERKAPTQSKIETLEQSATEYDFAVIILTKDDVLAKDSGEKLKVRDDCVFEAGYFMSAIGRNRCFLVSSVGSRDLPLDLGGIIRLTFEEPKRPEDFDDREKCEEAIQGVSALIKNRVQQVRKEEARRSVSTRPLSRDELLMRERISTIEGGHLLEDQVVVAAYQPRELHYASAKQVRANLDAGIRYVYFVRGDKEAADKIPRMLQLVLLANLITPEEEGSYQRRSQLVKASRDQIIEDLKDICRNDKLNIYFLSEPLDVEYFIHNAGDRDLARLYLKRRDEYIEWHSGEAANRFWRDAIEKRGADDPIPRDAVFHGARNFNLKEEEFYSRLRREMRNNFSDFEDQVLRLCLEGPQE